jgi:hypothetical protein
MMAKVAIVIKVVEDYEFPVAHRSVEGVYSDIEAAQEWVDQMNAARSRKNWTYFEPSYEIEIKELT